MGFDGGNRTVTMDQLIAFMARFVEAGGTGKLYADANGSLPRIAEELAKIVLELKSGANNGTT